MKKENRQESEKRINEKRRTSGFHKKLETLKKCISYLQPIDPALLEREYHQLTEHEFTSIFYKGAIEQTSPKMKGKILDIIREIQSPSNPKMKVKTISDIIKEISLKGLKIYFPKALRLCHDHYFELINEALTEKKEKINIDTLKEIQFRSNYAKTVKSYCRYYKIDIY